MQTLGISLLVHVRDRSCTLYIVAIIQLRAYLTQLIVLMAAAKAVVIFLQYLY